MQGTAFVNYKDTDLDDTAARVSGFFSYPGPNMLFYSVICAAASCNADGSVLEDAADFYFVP